MLTALYTAATGMDAQQFNIDTISNNLANVDTTGFKKVRPEFQDLFYQMLQQPVAPSQGQGAPGSPTGVFVGLGVKPTGSETLFQQGSLTETDNPLDVAISGDGFFTVSTDNSGTNKFYTRDGSFQLDANGNLVTSDGDYVLDSSGSPITLVNTEPITIASDGAITNSATTGSSSSSSSSSSGVQLGIVTFPNESGLVREGDNLFAQSVASGDPVTSSTSSSSSTTPSYTVEQDYLESSNVQVVDEMVNLITAERAYEMNSKTITTCDDMLNIADNMKTS
ncbi:MAG: flagellar basal-body rod protein FlgG [Thermacetogeniaceae bacterium]|jgi:flagellar basal-body rod protein FlgG